MRILKITSSVAITGLLTANIAYANPDEGLDTLRQQINTLKTQHEGRISELENQLEKTQSSSTPKTSSNRNIYDNGFNPSIGIVLNGQYSDYSSEESEIAGFTIGHEGERAHEGFAVDHTELNFSANIDDKFFGSTTFAIAEHEGETEIELEEAFIQTLPTSGLPTGMTLKAGRALWTLGYLNEHHAHTDDFADRPLPYRVYLDNAYNDDGLEISYVLPTALYTEIGAGIFKGGDFPFGENEGKAIGSWSAFTRIGGDIADTQTWRLGASVLSGESEGGRVSNDEELTFIGETDLYILDLRYTFAPTGNARQKELLLQSEYFWRDENGTYEDASLESGAIAFDDSTSGWYAQGVYKFLPQWRFGVRYSKLNSADVSQELSGGLLDTQNHDPETYAAMLDWTNSEFSRIRLQYSTEELALEQDDKQIILQYTMSLGAHGAHKY